MNNKITKMSLKREDNLKNDQRDRNKYVIWLNQKKNVNMEDKTKVTKKRFGKLDISETKPRVIQ